MTSISNNNSTQPPPPPPQKLVQIILYHTMVGGTTKLMPMVFFVEENSLWYEAALSRSVPLNAFFFDNLLPDEADIATRRFVEWFQNVKKRFVSDDDGSYIDPTAGHKISRLDFQLPVLITRIIGVEVYGQLKN